ncbi:MAG: 16S rRNA (cytosine(1402)-N(4))-methyltransferase RsmH [Oscillospiraceae bacterium]|nr:16S rRNA (cytosine(1402)-N(4))-methyltransferase RsmH [Oscillospiraceae bacterium]
MPEFHHISVLHDECIDALRVRPDGVYVDATLGGAGHAVSVAERLTEGGKLYGIDRDADALAAAGARLAPFAGRVELIHADFRTLGEKIHEKIDGILFDLGVSSYQLDEAERGFSYMADAPLDMRMDRSADLTAYDVVNTYAQADLARIISEYGEERYARAVAGAIVRARENAPIRSTLELASIVASAVPNAKKEKQHPAKRTFQAIRIEVNDELSAIAPAIDAAVDLLKPGGRIAVISFHSLEDRIVKQRFRALSQGCTCPPEFPVCVCGGKAKLKLIGKPVTASPQELLLNPRARSAKLRIAERTEE